MFIERKIMLNKQDIQTKITTLLAEQLQKDVTTLQPAAILKNLGVDELDFIVFIMAIEESFSLLITDQDLQDLQTIEDITLCVERLQKRSL